MVPFKNLLSLTLFILFVIVSSSQAKQEDPPCPSLPDEPGSVQLCPVSCFRPDPVCGENGVTYWCGCPEAACAGVGVAKRGFCEVGNGGGTGGQAFLLVHIVWLIVIGFSVLCGFL